MLMNCFLYFFSFWITVPNLRTVVGRKIVEKLHEEGSFTIAFLNMPPGEGRSKSQAPQLSRKNASNVLLQPEPSL